MEVISFSVTDLRLLHVLFLALGLVALRLTTIVGLCNALVFICIFYKFFLICPETQRKLGDLYSFKVALALVT